MSRQEEMQKNNAKPIALIGAMKRIGGRTQVFALLVFLLCTFWVVSVRADLPPFDYEKAKQLSPEKQRTYDVIFFNEIAIWDMSGNRYGSGLGDSFFEREAEFQRMAKDGYLPAYAALRLLKIIGGEMRHDPEALAMLLKAAKGGDASAMCALVAIPQITGLMPESERIDMASRMVVQGAALGHGACEGLYGKFLQTGLVSKFPRDIQAAKPLLLESARQGYYVGAKGMFGLRFMKALSHQFDFSDQAEFRRALCWGRLAEQHTNWTGFHDFLGMMRDYARINNRPDLVELSRPYDPQRVPITQIVVKPEDCIQLESGE